MAEAAADGLRVGVRDCRQARAALAWAAAGRHVILLYGLDARRLGVGFWSACSDMLARPMVVDCGAHVGTVLAALRVGLDRIHFEVDGPQLPALLGLLDAHGASRVVTPPTLCLDAARTVAGQLARWRFEHVTGPSVPVKDRPYSSIHHPRTGRSACD